MFEIASRISSFGSHWFTPPRRVSSVFSGVRDSAGASSDRPASSAPGAGASRRRSPVHRLVTAAGASALWRRSRIIVGDRGGVPLPLASQAGSSVGDRGGCPLPLASAAGSSSVTGGGCLGLRRPQPVHRRRPRAGASASSSAADRWCGLPVRGAASPPSTLWSMKRLQAVRHVAPGSAWSRPASLTIGPAARRRAARAAPRATAGRPAPASSSAVKRLCR